MHWLVFIRSTYDEIWRDRRALRRGDMRRIICIFHPCESLNLRASFAPRPFSSLETIP